MANNERKSGESNKQYLDRIKAQQREQRIQERIDRVKNREDYGGELEPARLTVEQNPATISQGYQTVGRRNNDHRVGQKSIFGEREYDPNPSLIQRFGNWITDGLHLTSPPTFQDGYGRTLNAEVPTWESAQGQELKRMGKTTMTDAAIVAAPFGMHQFYVNPLAMSAAVGSGALVDQGTKTVLNEVNDQLNESGKQLSENQQNAIRTAVGLFSGNKAYKWGDRATKRGLEVAMHTTGVSNPVSDLTRGWKMRSLSQKKDVLNYIITGKNKNGNSNTLGAILKNKEVIPTFYTGLNGAENQISIPKYGHDAVRTYLYGEPLLSFKSIKNPELGVHSDYVLKKYPNLYSMLDPNEAYAVNMYYKDSPSLWKAFSSGRDTGTHTGMLIFNNDKQDWEVVHNIHGKLYVDDLINTLGSGKQYGITSIYKTNIPDKPVEVDFNKYLYK